MVAEDPTKTPQIMGYLAFTEWAVNREREIKESIEKAVLYNNYAKATYFKLIQNDHRENVERLRKGYSGV